ncbi:cysteine hydrolase [Candidatus Bipolaricaulota bacterium]|nr:cysteine hydrolase [Candidatus Bipolaricaulota bacterium]
MTVTKALVVIDVQPIFMKAPLMLTLDGDDLVAKCKALIERAREGGTPVVFVQHVDKDELPEGTTDADMAFHPELTPQEDEPVIGKMFGSGFMETALDETLKTMEIQELIVCGLSAYGCVNQTVLFAKLFGYHVTVVQDAIGAPSYEQWPVTGGIPIFLANWEKGGIHLKSAKDVMTKV